MAIAGGNIMHFVKKLRKGIVSSLNNNMNDMGRKPLLVVSLHKSGTHLITRILALSGLNRRSIGKNAPPQRFLFIDY